MSISAGDTSGARPRVRHQARDALAVAAFSAFTSAGLVVVLLILMFLGRQA